MWRGDDILGLMFQKGSVNQHPKQAEGTQKGYLVQVGDYYWMETWIKKRNADPHLSSPLFKYIHSTVKYPGLWNHIESM